MTREDPPSRDRDGRDGAQSVRRALAVLRLVASGQERGVRMIDIANMSGLSKPTVHRLLKVLIDETAVEQDPLTRRYLVGPELSLLGLARGGRFAIRAIAGPYLQALAAEVGDTVFLSVSHGADSVCIARHVGSYPIQVLSIDVGVRRPLGASVSGIVLLAGMDPADARALTEANRPRLTAAGRDVEALLRDIDTARAQGHIYAAPGVMPGTSAAAIPILDSNGGVLAAVSITALSERLDRKRLPAILSQAKAQAEAITQRHREVSIHAARRSC